MLLRSAAAAAQPVIVRRARARLAPRNWTRRRPGV